MIVGDDIRRFFDVLLVNPDDIVVPIDDGLPGEYTVRVDKDGNAPHGKRLVETYRKVAPPSDAHCVIRISNVVIEL